MFQKSLIDYGLIIMYQVKGDVTMLFYKVEVKLLMEDAEQNGGCKH